MRKRSAQVPQEDTPISGNPFEMTLDTAGTSSMPSIEPIDLLRSYLGAGDSQDYEVTVLDSQRRLGLFEISTETVHLVAESGASPPWSEGLGRARYLRTRAALGRVRPPGPGKTDDR